MSKVRRLSYLNRKLSLLKLAAFYESHSDDYKWMTPVGADSFTDVFGIVQNHVNEISRLIGDRLLYDLSNDELDSVTKGLNSIIEWSKDAKVRMKDKQEYSGRHRTKMPAEFRADEKQEEQNVFEDKHPKSEAYYKLKTKLANISGV